MSYYSAPHTWKSESYFFKIKPIINKNDGKGENQPNNNQGDDTKEDYDIFLDLILNWNIENWQPDENFDIGAKKINSEHEKILAKFNMTYLKCKWLMAFWYPEAFLLHHRTPSTKELYDRWWRYLNNPSLHTMEIEFPLEICANCEANPLIETKPLLDASGWSLLKKSVKERWNTELGIKIKNQIFECFTGFNQSMWKGPKPNIGGEDLRGLHFDDFNCSFCYFGNYDLWNASFTKRSFREIEIF